MEAISTDLCILKVKWVILWGYMQLETGLDCKP